MAMYIDGKKITPYYQNGRPLSIYRNGIKLAGYHEESKTGDNIIFDNTYNDHSNILIQGRSRQDTKYYREATNTGVIQVSQHSENRLRKCQIDVIATQSGSGDPSPDNVPSTPIGPAPAAT
jgi:hypothetical protein